MENSKTFADSLICLTSNQILTKSFQQIHDEDQVEAGSSTACIVTSK
jgi:hypothetical protein